MVDAQPPDWLEEATGRTLVVLGADGFIGSWVARLALLARARVVGLCVKSPWRLTGVTDERLRLEPVPGGRWWEPAQLNVIARVLPGADAFVHLGYEPPAGGLDPAARAEHEHAVNAAAAARIVPVAGAAGARIVFASSADVYGPWHDEPVDESTPPAPATPYAEAKLAAERLVLESPGARCLRIATVFGPGELGPRAIPSFASALARGEPATLHGDGADLRDYVGVAEVARRGRQRDIAGGPGPRAAESRLGRRAHDALDARGRRGSARRRARRAQRAEHARAVAARRRRGSRAQARLRSRSGLRRSRAARGALAARAARAVAVVGCRV